MPHSLLVACLLAALVSAGSKQVSDSRSLAGPWQVRLDEADEGLAERWFVRPLGAGTSVRLPGSLAASALGHPFDLESGSYAGARRPYLAWPSAGYTDDTRADELGALVPSHIFLGPAWYERQVEVPIERDGSPWSLRLERVKWTSRLWIDGVEVAGEGSDSLYTAHEYRIASLAAGTHRFTLRIDNRPPIHIGLAGHGYGMETEPIWNGVVGAITLTPGGLLGFDRVRVFPRSDGTLGIRVSGHGPAGDKITIRARLRGPGDEGQAIEAARTPARVTPGDAAPGEPVRFSASLSLATAQPPEPWDEFRPALYRLELSLLTDDGSPADTRSLRIGFRDFARDGGRLLINGTPLFLRGNLDCAIHPGSDTPAMDRAWWERTFGIQKAAGFNHIRFHTWCPPEVAFDVADELGLYLQVETAYWVDNWIHETAPYPPRLGEEPAVDAWVLEESRRILRAYGHHPSFSLFCLGNEFGMGSDWATIDHLVAALCDETDTVLVSGTTARKSGPHDDYWVTHATARGSVRGLGAAHTDWDFSSALEGLELPVISHETGQRQSWPDYDRLLPAFDENAVIQPHNLTRLRDRAGAAGISDHRARCEASARFAHLLYKAEHEAMRRTRDLDGYQLLMLQDFTGQGEASVGLLDAFLREKPGISLPAIREWNGPSVPLARFPGYVWTSDQTFTATLQLAHQGPGALEVAEAAWTLHDTSHDEPVASGRLALDSLPAGTLTELGGLAIPLASVRTPARLELGVAVGGHRNSWSVWVYPASERPLSDLRDPNSDLHITRRLDAPALAVLARGGSVLLLFHGASGPRFRQTRWGSTFWTGAWGWGRGLGLRCDPAHPALSGFPNEGHSDWQWRELAEGGTCLSLTPERAAAGMVVEQLSTFHHPVREALLLEARVGEGRLLACGFDLDHDLDRRHAARALRDSLIAYAGSGSQRPGMSLTPAEAAEIFALSRPPEAVARADSEAPGYEAARAIDGDPATFWHTRWGAVEPPHPHELIVELADAVSLKGIQLKARADQANGRLAEVSLFLAQRDGEWGAPVVDHARLADNASWQQLDFPPTPARFLRLVTHREVGGRAFASLAELAVVEAGE